MYNFYTIGLDLGQRQDFTALTLMETQVFFPTTVKQPAPVGAVGIGELIHIVQQQPGRPSAPTVTPGWQSPTGIDRVILDNAVNGKLGPWPSKPPIHVRSLKRYPIGTSYPDIIKDVQRLMAAPEVSRLGSALVIDGTGVGVAVTDMFYEAGMNPISVTITGGHSVTRDEYSGGWRVPKRDLVGAVQAMLQTGRLHISKALPDAHLLEAEMLNFKVTIDPRTAHDSYSAWREQDHDDLVLSVALAAWYRDSYWGNYDRALVADRLTV